MLSRPGPHPVPPVFSPALPLRPRVLMIALGGLLGFFPHQTSAVVFVADDSAVPWAVASWARQRAQARSSLPQARAHSICRAACSSTGSPWGHRTSGPVSVPAQRPPAPRPLWLFPWAHKPGCGGPGSASCQGRSKMFSGSRAEDRSPAVGAVSQRGAHLCHPHPTLRWKENGR